jgi:hypothetical protein
MEEKIVFKDVQHDLNVFSCAEIIIRNMGTIEKDEDVIRLTFRDESIFEIMLQGERVLFRGVVFRDEQD